MTLGQLIKRYRRHGVIVRNAGTTCTIEMKDVTIISPIQTDENFIKATFSNGKYIMEVTAWTKAMACSHREHTRRTM